MTLDASTAISQLIISDVMPGSPAETAGLEIQDIILTIDDKPVGSLPIFGMYLYMLQAGDRVKIVVLRGAEELDMQVPVMQRQHNVDRRNQE